MVNIAPVAENSSVYIMNDGPRPIIVEVVSEHSITEPQKLTPGKSAHRSVAPYRYLLVRYEEN